MTKKLLALASIGEVAFGIFVVAVPALAYSLLFGGDLSASGAIMARIAGLALVGLGIACYPPGVRQGYYAMLTYSTLVGLYFVIVGTAGAAGVLLWPAVVFHVLLSASLIVAARMEQPKS